MPHDAPRFHLISGNRLDVLAAHLGARLAQAADPLSLAPDVVLIPQPTLRQWLQQTLAERYGIAANLDLVTPSEFVWRLLRGATPGLPADSPWDRERLRWRLYALLRDGGDRLPAVVREHLRRAAGGAGRDGLLRADRMPADQMRADLVRDDLADALAGAFDKYQAYRRDWLQAWERGEQAQDWQAALWRMLRRAHDDVPHRAALIGDWLARYAAPPHAAVAPPPGLPPQLSAFGTIHVSPDVLRMLAACARWCALDFYLPTPSGEYWGDVESLRARLRRENAEAWPALLAEAQQDNPLLQAWGAGGRDIIAQLFDYDTVQPERESEHFVDPGRDTVLHRLQSDVLHRAAPLRDDGDGIDGSLQIHACHSKLREVEVLHDRLRAMLDNDLPEGLRFDPPLQPREIAVLAPNIADYLPLARAVFGGVANDDPRHIPFSLADQPQANSHPLVECLIGLLALPETPITSSRFREWLALPAVARAHGLDAAALAKIDDWFDAAGIRWGDDEIAHMRAGAGRWREYSFAFGIDRLLAGYAASGGSLLRGKGDTLVAPYADLEGGDADILDAVLRFHARLHDLDEWMRQAHAAQDWQTRISAFFQASLLPAPVDDAEARARRDVLEALSMFADDAQEAGLLPAAVVRRALQQRLSQPSPHRPWLAGGVVFAGMVPLRTVPFRVICLLGMDAEAYPRREPGSDINRLIDAAQGRAPRRLGDRSVREDDRFLFLQLLCAAGDVLYLSYGGRDARDGSRREPSAVVDELLDAIERMHGSATRERLVLQHPLQPFSAQAFGADDGGGREPRRFSYRSEWQTPTPQAGAGLEAPPAFVAAESPPAVVSIGHEARDRDALQIFFANPAKYWLRERLGLRLMPVEARETDREPQGIDGLSRYGAIDALLQPNTDSESCVDPEAALRARAVLPPGRDGVALAHDANLIARMLRTARSEAFGGVAPERATEAVADDGVTAGGIAFRFDDLHHGVRVITTAGGLDGRRRLHAGIDHLLLASVLGEAARTHLIGYDRKTAALVDTVYRDIDRAHARAALEALLALWKEGQAAPLPFAPKSAFAYAAKWREKQDARAAWNEALRVYAPFGYAGEGDDVWLQLAFRPRGLLWNFDDAVSRRFREIAVQVFDAQESQA